ncbi:MAG: formylglycine-generating enzyme family protein [bacterium]|nr:formylglycine-generating enzyme family protein [bacterium]
MTRLAMITTVVLVCVSGVQADVVMETVPVGNPGNAGELSGDGAGGYGPDAIVGAVDYAYNMGKYEVTAGQYTEFLNAVAQTDTYGLYSDSMWSQSAGCKIQRTGLSGSYSYSVDPDGAARPVNKVSWYDALRFANWMHNGQGSGDTEDGAYDMSLGSSVVRKPGALVFLPSEDEWYKAAYYDPDKADGAGYWDYPTSSDSMPGRDMTEAANPGNNANYWSWPIIPYPIDSPYFTTVAGEFQLSDSPYGTFDQGGNVWEWNEAVFGSSRGLSGGSFNVSGNSLAARYRNCNSPTSESVDYGFRVASEVPEPCSLVLLALGGLLAIRRRR